VLLRIYALLSVALSPIVLAWARLNPRLSADLDARLARDLRGRRAPEGRPRIWIHAVSVGETAAAAPVAEESRKRFPGAFILFTTTTVAGYETALRRLEGSASETRFFPLDLPWVVERVIRFYRPDVFVCTEADVWPNLLMELRRKGIPTIVFNARLIDRHGGGRSSSASSLTRRFVSEAYGLFDVVIAQSEPDVAKFVALGVNAAKIEVGGNTKFDQTIPPLTEDGVIRFKDKWGWKERKVILAASTHEGEEEIILRAFIALRRRRHDLALVLAPRHTERAASVSALVSQTPLWWQRYSMFTDIQRAQSVLVVDVMGVLAGFYQIADCVIVGGTFSERVGGHSLLEAAQFRKPIIVGPHTQTVAGQVERLLANGGVVQLHEACADTLADAIEAVLSSAEHAAELGEHAYAFYAANQGASSRVVDRIARLIEGKR
jgi:3-deoxy-D-manno-octulosonic-acid transferase